MADDIFGNKSERGVEKAFKIAAQPASDFDPVRVSVELSAIEVQALNILYNTTNPEVIPDMKALAKFMLNRGMDSSFKEIKGMLQIHEILKNLPPELRDLFEGFGKGGPQT